MCWNRGEGSESECTGIEVKAVSVSVLELRRRQ